MIRSFKVSLLLIFNRINQKNHPKVMCLWIKAVNSHVSRSVHLVLMCSRETTKAYYLKILINLIQFLNKEVKLLFNLNIFK